MENKSIETRKKAFSNEYDFNRDEDEIGSGTFGTVYSAKNKQTGQEVALKIINFSKFNDEKEISQALIELDLLTKINHPFIIKALDTEIGNKNFK